MMSLMFPEKQTLTLLWLFNHADDLSTFLSTGNDPKIE